MPRKSTGKPRGRPTFKPTNAQRTAVAELSGGGMSQEAIARTLKINVETLVKYFRDELTEGGSRKRAEILRAMFKAAKKGNVAAARFYTAMQIQSDTVPAQPGEQPAAAAPASGPVPSTQQVVADGKKAQQNLDAITAQIGTDWEKLLPPPRVM